MKKVFNLIIVDESGSMSVIRQQALSGINETLQTVRFIQEQHADMEQNVSLLFFDDGHRTYKYLNTPATQTTTLTLSDYNPRGCTPLYDAIGDAVGKLNAVVGKDDDVLVTIITDGYENASREFTLSMIQNLIDKLKEQNWVFTLIGTDNLNVGDMAKSMNIDEHMAFTQDEAGTMAMFAKERKSRSSYMSRLINGVEHSRERGSFFDV